MKMLIVDDDKVTRDLLQEVFEKTGFTVSQCASGEEAVERIKTDSFSIVLTDLKMLGVDGFQVLAKIKEKDPCCALILMTGFGTMESAVKAIHEGAFEFISKPFQIEDLKAIVEKAKKHVLTLQSAASESHKKIQPERPRSLIGKSARIVEVYKELARASLTSSNILIFGESGTGKELVARAIHDNSSRRTHKFMPVNCGALTESLLESELFGHVKGAFTGATSNKSGLFEECHQGTLFLDEIGDISLAMQVRLLRVLQEGEFKPVGSNDIKKTDVRIIAATHKDLEQQIKEGLFREDLYYRLKVVSIQLPPLRERLEDLPELINHFISIHSSKMNKTISHVSEEAILLLMNHPWPGNIRELENAIERAVAMTRTTILYPEDFSLTGAKQASDNNSLEDIEKKHILKVLESVGWNKTKAAKMLGIDRKTLRRKAVSFGISLKDDE